MSTKPVPPDADLVARLRAVDPAAGTQVDLEALRSVVDERRAAQGDAAVGEAPAAEDGSTAGAGADDELARARARRGLGWPARAAAVAAAALVVGGGGGYALGAAGDGPETTAAGTITLESGPEAASGAADGAGGDSGAAGGGPELMQQDRAAGMDASMPYWPGGGRTVFTSSGLSTEGGTAAAWAFDPQAVFTEGTAATAAAALGVDGSPVLGEDGVWRVGDVEGLAPRIELVPDGTASLSYYDPTKDPWSCSEQDLTDEGACTEKDLGPAPQGDAARATLADLLRDLGLDPDGYEIVAEDSGEESWSYVTAFHVVDDQRTGLQWGASFSGAGVQSLHGSLAPVVALGDYDVVSPTEAVERLGDPRFGAGGGGPIAYVDGATPRGGVAEMPVEPDRYRMELPRTPAEGADVAWPVDQVQIVDSRLGVAVHTQADGAAMLVPTYELTSSDGGIWSVVAVTEDHLDLSPRP